MLTMAQTLNALYGLLIRWSSVRVAHNQPTFKQNINNLARYFDCQKLKLAPQNWTCSAKNNIHCFSHSLFSTAWPEDSNLRTVLT